MLFHHPRVFLGEGRVHVCAHPAGWGRCASGCASPGHLPGTLWCFFPWAQGVSLRVLSAREPLQTPEFSAQPPPAPWTTSLAQSALCSTGVPSSARASLPESWPGRAARAVDIAPGFPVLWDHGPSFSGVPYFENPALCLFPCCFRQEGEPGPSCSILAGAGGGGRFTQCFPVFTRIPTFPPPQRRRRGSAPLPQLTVANFSVPRAQGASSQFRVQAPGSQHQSWARTSGFRLPAFSSERICEKGSEGACVRSGKAREEAGLELRPERLTPGRIDERPHPRRPRQPRRGGRSGGREVSPGLHFWVTPTPCGFHGAFPLEVQGLSL